MTNPVVLFKREIRDFLNFRQFLKKQTGAELNKNNLELVYQFAVDHITPIQKKTEIIALIDYLNEHDVRSYCEIGLANGGTCFLVSNGVRTVERVYGIDIQIFNKRLQQHFADDACHLEFKTGSSTDTKVVDWLKKKLESKKLDVLFIDGDHSYEGVKKYFENYHSFVRDNGLIVFHDIIPEHWQKYGIKTNRDTGGVPKFYHEITPYFVSKEFIENKDQDGFGIGVIHYDKDNLKNWQATYADKV